MSDQETQNYGNHTLIPVTMLIAVALLLCGVVLAVVGLFLVKSTAGTCLIGTGAALIGLTSSYGLILVRTYATKLQDRIIRTEMRLRLEKILPEDLQGEIPRLSIKQLVGLRFASDGEMADLVRRVVAENIQDTKAIKQSVKDWQGDHYRV